MSTSPLTTAAFTGFSVMSLGDAAAQFASDEPQFDAQRNVVSAVYSGGMSPVFYTWYRLMDTIFGTAVSVRILIPKTILSQIVTTGVNNPVYLTWCNHMEAWSGAETTVDWAAVRERTAAQITRELPNLYGFSMLFWLPVTSTNFALVPDHLRILFVSSCSVIWGGFVSYVAHKT